MGNYLLFFTHLDSVFVWDTHLKDGYKRSNSINGAEKKFCPTWDGTKNSSVVQELLKRSSNKAYGTEGKIC